MGFDNPIVGGTALRIPAIQSPDYAAGTTGWIVRIDGSAEFNNLVVRGQFEGNDFVIDANGIFLYSSTPAAGNLTGSWTAAAGTDAFGNAYGAGLSLYSSQGTINLSVSGGDTVAKWLDTVNGSEIDLAVGGGSAQQRFTPPSAAGVTWQPGSITATKTSVFGTNTAEMAISGPYNTAHVSAPTIALFGSSDTQASNRIDLTTQNVNVSGDLDAGSMASGTATTPAPGVGGGTSTVAVSFGKTFSSTPQVLVTARSAADPSTTTITAYVDSTTTTGCTIRAFRSTNSSTVWSWWAVV